MRARPLLGFLQWAHRLILHLYPREFRREYGRDMRDVFLDICLAQSRRPSGGGLALSGTWTLVRIAKNGLGVRFGGRQRPTLDLSLRFDRPASPSATFLGALGRDTRFALRALTHRPGSSLLIVGMLALGIGSSTAIFNLLDSLYLRPLPFERPDRLVMLDETAPRWNLDLAGISPPDFAAWYEHNRTFDGMAVFADLPMNLAINGTADRVRTKIASWELASVLGVSPVLGRDFTARDDTEDAEPVVLLTHTAWRDRFASDPNVVGTVLQLDGVVHSVIGVLPPAATLPYSQVDLWVPAHTLAFCCDSPEHAASYWLKGIGRLADGTTIELARKDLERAHATLLDSLGWSREIATPFVQPYTEYALGGSRQVLFLLLGAAVTLLLIACANISGLMLARTASRVRELGLRTALGASRWRLARQLFTESSVLAAAGGVIGITCGYTAFRAMVALVPTTDFAWVSVSIDWRLAVFSFSVVGLSALVFGVLPAVHAARVDAPAALRNVGARAISVVVRRRALGGLVIAEITLAVVLLISAGLLARALHALQELDRGFRGDAFIATVALPQLGYEELANRLAFFESLEANVTALPGVWTAGLSTQVPLGGHGGYFFAVDNATKPSAEVGQPVTLVRLASDAYFEAMGIDFVAGGAFSEYDGPSAQAVVVNEAFALHYWNRVDVVGERIRPEGNTSPWLTIVGVNRNTRHYGLDADMRPGVFLPYRSALEGPLGDRYVMSLAVAGALAPADITERVRAAVRAADPTVPVYDLGTMDEWTTRSTFQRRAYSTLLTFFAGAALLLAAAGVYSTLSYAVSQRRQEIGIRMALGARSTQVRRHILAEGGRTAAVGLVAGLGLSVPATRAMSSVLLGISPFDPTTYVAVAATLAVASLSAIWIPALRASRTNPIDSLRSN